MKLSGEIIILEKPGKIKFKPTEIDTKKIKPSEIVAKTIFSAISPGTETAAYSGSPSLRPGKTYPRLLGYCNVATVIAVGKNIKSVKPGSLILTGESHRSIFIIEEKNIIAKVPKNIDPKLATLTYLYNLGLTSLQTIRLKTGTDVAVIGLGALGLGAVEVASALGFHPLALSNSPHKLKLAQTIGAQKTYLKSDNKKLDGSADLTVTTSNSWEDWELALRITKDRGIICVLGFPGRGMPLPKFNPLEPKYFYDKKITIAPVGIALGQTRPKNDFSAIQKNCNKILKLISGEKIDPTNLISGIYDYRDIEQAYNQLLSKDQKSITYILKWPK